MFPLQVAILLSEPGRNFEGGEFVLIEQRAQVMPLRQGEAVIFAVHSRPVHASRGVYRGTMRYGVSRIRSGRRQMLGIIFHYAERGRYSCSAHSGAGSAGTLGGDARYVR